MFTEVQGAITRRFFSFDTTYPLTPPLLAVLAGTSSGGKTDNKVSERIRDLGISPPWGHPRQQSRNLLGTPDCIEGTFEHLKKERDEATHTLPCL